MPQVDFSLNVDGLMVYEVLVDDQGRAMMCSVSDMNKYPILRKNFKSAGAFVCEESNKFEQYEQWLNDNGYDSTVPERHAHRYFGIRSGDLEE